MRFLLDQDVYAATFRFLIDLGHDTVRAIDLGLSQASDERLLAVATEQRRILVTRDRHFGALVFVNALGSGVLYLRLLPSTLKAVHDELARVLKLYEEDQLRKAFIVIEANGHRIRRLPTE